MSAITKLRFSIFLLVLALLTLGLGGIADASDTVEKVSVAVSGSPQPPSRILKRMEVSIATVGDQLLVGRDTDEIAEHRGTYEKLIKDVFDRVLVGYSVQQVSIVPGRITGVTVGVAPWGDVVQDIKLDVDYGSISPGVVKLIAGDLGNIEDKIAGVLVGMPVESVEWAGGVSKSVIREILAAQLPEFRSNLEITAGPETKVRLSLTPTGPTVQSVTVALRSRSIPNILLFEARKVVEAEGDQLRGLPVDFVERHQDYFSKLLTDAAARHPVAERYGLSLSTDVLAGPDTKVIIDAETKKYNVTLEGYLDMGKTVDNTSARLHLGKNMGKRDELFLETTFIPGSVTWDFAPGWGHRVGTQTEVGVKYNVNEEQSVLWGKQQLGSNWSLRLERTPGTGTNEVGLRYKLHDFLSAEYIINNKDHWLRLIGNL